MSRGSNSDASGRVLVERRGACAVIRLNRTAERNQLSVSTLGEVHTTLSRLSTSTDLRAIIFTGAGDVFASGANIRELCELTPSAASEFARRGQRLMQEVADARALTVAAVNGYCMGGGLDLALACRLRVASAGAVFAHPGARLGIITGWGGTQRLARLVGAPRAFEMFLTARRVSAEEAVRIGLVSRLGDPALECALETTQRMIGEAAGG